MQEIYFSLTTGTFLRKIREIVLAYQITKKFNKNKILEIYLNQISLGNNSFGVEAAAETYFNKKLSQINLQEAALIAALPKGPTHLNPFKHYERARARRNWIIERMFENNFIDKKTFLEARETEIDLNFEKNKNQIGRNACWFAKDLILEYYKDNIENEKDFLNRGFKIKLTIDSEIQKIAQQIFDEHLVNLEKKENEYKPLSLKVGFKDEKDFEKNWHNKIKKIYNEYGEYFELAVVLEVQKDQILIGLQNGSFGVYIYSKFIMDQKKIKTLKTAVKFLKKQN